MSAGDFAWVKTSSHRADAQLRRASGWRLAFFKGQIGNQVGTFYRIPVSHLARALAIKGVTHAKTATREQMTPYFSQPRPSQKHRQ